ncbi:MAG: TRAM domain-containing protein, partial [Acidimicrobiia bacterium]|nr:TRAM domain-containing protein [Acidimicrobiia bacterium]
PRPGIRRRQGVDGIPGRHRVDLQQQITLEKNQALIGSMVEVLVEGPSRKDPNVVTTRTRTNKVVHLQGHHPVGAYLDAIVEAAAPSHLMGRLV